MSTRTHGGRRAFLAGCLGVAAGWPWAGATRARSAAGAMRLLKVRHSTFLLELEGIRALVDPCFTRALGTGPLAATPAPALEPERIGRHELLLVTSGRVDHFDGASVRRLGPGRPFCFAPDENVATALRDAGHRRVRVVVPGDTFEVAGVEVSVSPAQDGLTGAPAVGYRLSRRGRSVWHTGAPPPLDVFSEPVSWARKNASELVIACWDELSSADGRRLTMGALDGEILAALARARFVVPAHDDLDPTWLGGLVLRRAAGPAGRSLRGGAQVVVVERGVWYRVAGPGARAGGTLAPRRPRGTP